METALEKYTKLIPGFETMSFEERREHAASLREEHFHNKTTLKELFRVKPKPGQMSEYSYKGYYNDVPCFKLSQCVPMRARSTKQRSDAQVDSSRRLAENSKRHSKQNFAARRAQRLIENDTVLIDCETTSLTGFVISIAAISAKTGKTLLDSLVYTSEPIELGAYEVHGLTEKDLIGAPTFDVVAAQLRDIIGERTWTAFNREFDEAAMRRSLPKEALSDHTWLDNSAPCIMYDICADFFGSTNRYGSISLSASVEGAGLQFQGSSHNALADIQNTQRVLAYVAEKAL